MIYRLKSQKNSGQSLLLARSAWLWLLHTAEQSGWRPMGTVQPEFLYGLANSPAEWDEDSYTPSGSRLVMLEDALNLMDALEKFFEGYEPTLENTGGIFRTEWDDLYHGQPRPGIGSLLALAELCRAGSFFIEEQRVVRGEIHRFFSIFP